MGNTATLLVPEHHPAFDGHFPGAPLLPGVVLLDEMLHLIPGAGAGWTISSAKFLHPVRPGDSLTLEYESPLANGSVRFTIRSGPQLVATGTFAHGNKAG
jgi:3-hydroxyacyl-[acyl-carrier-protein] dehydratase